jgi:GntR family transcriptional regulator/MocR family aminotransferase
MAACERRQGFRSPSGLFIHIETRALGGLQQQIYLGVRRAILDGVLAPGTGLPSSRSLAGDLRVSRTTTLCAYGQLAAEGYLAARRGSGTFVARELPDDLARPALPRVVPRVTHPQLSGRGVALVSTPGPARRLGGPPRPFRLGVPALDLFPLRLWSQLVIRRLRSTTMGQLDYSDSAGFAELRQAVAEHVQTARGTRCIADQVFIVSGAQRALQIVCGLLLDPGDPVWLEEPGYPGARSAFLGAGARIVPVHVDREGLDVAAAARRAANARMAYVTPSHQFPLGVTMSLARRLALLKWASAAGAWVVEDDYDSEFRYGVRSIPCLHGLDADGRVIYVGTFAKTVFPAMRLGFFVVPLDLRDKVLAARRTADFHPPLLEQMVLADFIAEGHYARHLRRMQTAIASGSRRSPTRPTASAVGRFAFGWCRRASMPSPTSTASTKSGSTTRPGAAASKWPRSGRTSSGRDGATGCCWDSRRPIRTPCGGAWNSSPPRLRRRDSPREGSSPARRGRGDRMRPRPGVRQGQGVLP